MKKTRYDIFLRNWLDYNDSQLTESKNEKWTCLRVVSGTELKIAFKLKNRKIPFFIPLFSMNEKFSPFISGYIFCRIKSKQRDSVNSIGIKIIDTEGEKSYNHFLNELKSLASYYEIDKIKEFKFNSGEEIFLEGGMKANVIQEIENSDELLVSLKLFNRKIKTQVKKKNVIKISDPKSDLIYVKKDITLLREKFPNLEVKKKLEKVEIQFNEINEELIKYLSKKPEDIFKLNPYKYEELVADLLKDMGYDIFLTPKSRDGGRDILAVIKIPPNKEILTIVECKQHSPKNKIGQAIVERFLFTIMRNDISNRGLIATTSTFTKGAKLVQEKHKWILDLYNHNDITDWLKNYGKWSVDKNTGLWIPKTDIVKESKLWIE